MGWLGIKVDFFLFFDLNGTRCGDLEMLFHQLMSFGLGWLWRKGLLGLSWPLFCFGGLDRCEEPLKNLQKTWLVMTPFAATSSSFIMAHLFKHSFVTIEEKKSYPLSL